MKLWTVKLWIKKLPATFKVWWERHVGKKFDNDETVDL